MKEYLVRYAETSYIDVRVRAEDEFEAMNKMHLMVGTGAIRADDMDGERSEMFILNVSNLADIVEYKRPISQEERDPE